MRKHTLCLLAFLVVLSAQAAFADCQQSCIEQLDDCRRSCSQCTCEWDYESCLSNCQWADWDGDGVVDPSDNCPNTPNANQANCDGDAFGNVCDSFNANYQAVTPEKTCWTDKDQHSLGSFTFEHHVEWLERDMSSCGATDRWRSRIRKDNTCVLISDLDCCMGLRVSISAVGDSPTYWCNVSNRNVNYCH